MPGWRPSDPSFASTPCLHARLPDAPAPRPGVAAPPGDVWEVVSTAPAPTSPRLPATPPAPAALRLAPWTRPPRSAPIDIPGRRQGPPPEPQWHSPTWTPPRRVVRVPCLAAFDGGAAPDDDPWAGPCGTPRLSC